MRIRFPCSVLLALGAAVALAASASATTLHVAPTRFAKGTTTLPCTADAPCNLGFALANAAAGDDVAMAAGNYLSPLPMVFGTQGPYDQPLVVPPGVELHGAPGARPVIHAMVSANATPAVQLGQGSVLRDVSIDAVTALPSGTVAYGLLTSPGAMVERAAVRATGSAGAIVAACAISAGVLRDSECLGAGAAGRVDGVSATSLGMTVYRLANVTAITTAPEGIGVRIGVSSGAGTMTASNVIARGQTSDLDASAGLPGGSAVLVIDHSNWNSISGSSVAGSSAQIITGPGNQAGPTAASPRFVDATAGDYRQAAGSPTIDAGETDAQNGPLALDGVPRALGAGTDIGADEFVPPPAAAGGGVGAAGASAAADTTPPSLDGLAIPRSWTRARGARVRFTLSEPATVTLAFLRRAAGRRVGAVCRPVRRANRARPRCVRLLTRGRLVLQGAAGANVVHVSGRLPGGRSLGPGSYRLRAVAVDAAGNRGAPRAAGTSISA